MEWLATRILNAFDEPGRPALELQALLEVVSRGTGAGREAICGCVQQLLAEGLLRREEEGRNLYARTEDGRLALAGPRDVTLYTRPGCHLCEEAKAAIAPILAEFSARLREVNIDDDALLRKRYANDVPVIFIGLKKAAKHRVDPAQLRRQLARGGK